VHSVRRLDLDVLDGAPGPVAADQFVLERADGVSIRALSRVVNCF